MNKTPKMQVNFRLFLESEEKLQNLKQQQKTDTSLEITISDRNSEEYKKILERKKKRAQDIKQLEDIINRNSPRLDELDIKSANTLIVSIKEEIRLLDEEILNTDEDTVDQELILEKLKELCTQLEIKEATLRQESVNNFTEQAKLQRFKNINKDQTIIFNQARKNAENTVKDILIMDHGEIASMFSTDNLFLDYSKGPVTPQKKFISWPHIIKGRDGNIIPLSPGIQVPKKFDKEKKIYKDYIFTLSSFFKNPKFISTLNEYYNPLGLEMSINQDKKFKNKWWIKLLVVSLDGMIQFPNNSNIDILVTQMSSFGDESF